MNEQSGIGSVSIRARADEAIHLVLELATKRAISKPWGVSNPGQWFQGGAINETIGEIWFERSGARDPPPALLLKVLLTSEPLSIQVHPDDDYARSIGLPNGKSEVWYILAAGPGSRVALGLNKTLTALEFRRAVGDGSIADLVDWRSVSVGDVMEVPAGTVHAVGPGLVLVEIQQASDATFRLFDHGRDREIHLEHGLAAANLGRSDLVVSSPNPFTERATLAANAHFVVERIQFPPNRVCSLNTVRSSWLMTLDGAGCSRGIQLAAGDVIYVEAENVRIETSDRGLVCLLAYESTSPSPKVGWRSAENDAPHFGLANCFPFSEQSSRPHHRAVGAELEPTR